MASISDIEKISELGKIDIPNLKLILRELLDDIRDNEEQNQDMQVDISAILKLLFEKGFISKEEYENLKDKINSLIDSDKVDNAYDDELSDDVIEEIIASSRFKGFYPTYEELVTKFPISKATHGDFAYVRDFSAGTYDVNNIETFIFDVKFGKWMSATDTTHLRNVMIREDEPELGRTGQPLDNDLLQYDAVIKRWLCKTYEEADVARKSHLDFHVGNQIELIEDIKGSEDGSIKDDGRLIVKLNTEVPNDEPMHISKNTFKKLLEEIDKDYFTRVHVDVETDELGVQRIIILGDDNDEYGNAIRRNITNKVLKKILKNLYDKLLSTFDIQKDPVSGRLLNIDEQEPAKYVPHGINTYNVDKIIDAIDKDYNNAFRISDKEETNYVDILKRVLKGYNELNIDEYNVQFIIERLTKLYENKTLWDRYTKILKYEENKNMTPEVFNELIDIIHYLYISKDLIRDEILERDVVLNGEKTFTDKVKFSGKKFSITNQLCDFLINAGLINFDNKNGVILSNSQYINFNNNQSIFNIASNEVNISNSDGGLKVAPNSEFAKDVVIKGNLTVEGVTTTVNSENLSVEDNIITINSGETGNGVSKYASGIEIDRGTANNLFIGFDETRDKLVTGLIEDETPESFSKLNEVAVLENGLDIKKPIVYNPEKHLLENSTMLRTDIDGATTFIFEVSNSNFKVLDPVYFEGDELTLCSITTYERCEVIGIIGEVTNTYVKVVVTGFLPCDMDLPNGTVIYLLDGAIGAKKESLIIQRKVGIKVPNGMVVDIQKNSGKESTEVKTECIMHRVLEPFVEMVVPDEDFEFEHNTKIFIDGVLQIEDVTYEIDYQKNFLRILEPFEDRVDLLMITAMEWANDGNQYVTNKEVDDMFTHGIEPRPPFEDTEYLQDYEVDRIFGIISSLPDAPDVVKPNEAEWCKDSDVDNIFSARALYSKYNLLEQSITKNIFVEGNFIYYFSDKKYLDELDFVEIDKNGIFNKISFDTKNIVGIIQQITEFDNGLIEYQINTSKIIPYSDIPLYKYSIKYGVEISQGENLYISDKINKFSGNLLCSFSNVAMFIEYEKKNWTIEQDTNKARKYTLENNKCYIFETNKMSITQLDLFEVDSPNYCKVNLINNTCMNEKNLFYEIQLGKKMFDMYRFDDKYVLKPIRDLNCFTELNIEETTNSNLIKI